jgi:hypothetical protein
MAEFATWHGSATKITAAVLIVVGVGLAVYGLLNFHAGVLSFQPG